MSAERHTQHASDDAARADGWARHRREQLVRGLRLSPAERLRWLERTRVTLQRWKGRARRVRDDRSE